MGRPTATGISVHLRLSPVANLAIREIAEHEGLSLSDTASRIIHAELHRRAGATTKLAAGDFDGAIGLVEEMKAKSAV